MFNFIAQQEVVKVKLQDIKCRRNVYYANKTFGLSTIRMILFCGKSKSAAFQDHLWIGNCIQSLMFINANHVCRKQKTRTFLSDISEKKIDSKDHVQ